MFDFFHDKCKDISTVVVVLTVKVGSHYGHCGQVSCCCCVLRKYLSQYWGGGEVQREGEGAMLITPLLPISASPDQNTPGYHRHHLGNAINIFAAIDLGLIGKYGQ